MAKRPKTVCCRLLDGEAGDLPQAFLESIIISGEETTIYVILPNVPLLRNYLPPDIYQYMSRIFSTLESILLKCFSPGSTTLFVGFVSLYVCGLLFRLSSLPVFSLHRSDAASLACRFVFSRGKQNYRYEGSAPDANLEGFTSSNWL